MAEDTVGEPTIRLKVDPKQVASGLDAAVSAFKQGMAKVNAEMQRAQKAQASVTRQIQAEIDRITAVKATTQLQILGQAIDQMGGKAKLSDDQIKRLTTDVERLAAAGGRVPKSLTSFTVPSGAGGLGALTGSIEAQARQAAGALGPFGAALTALGPAGIAAGAGLAVTVGAVSHFVSFTSAIQDLSEKTLLSTTFLQELGFAGSMSGVSMEDAANAALILSRNVGEGADVFAKLGLSLEELRGLSPDEQFRRVAEAIRQIPDPARQTALALEAFGRGGKEILPLLRQGFGDLADEAHRLGVVLDEDAIKKGDELGDNWTKLQALASVTAARIGALTFQVTQFGTEVGKWIAEMSGLDEIQGPAIKGGTAAGIGAFTAPAVPGLSLSSAAKATEDMAEAERKSAQAARDDAAAQREREQAYRAAVQAVQQAGDAATKQREELEKASEAREKFLGQFGPGADELARQVATVQVAIEDLGAAGPLTAGQIEQITKKLLELQAQGATVPQELADQFGVTQHNIEETLAAIQNLHNAWAETFNDVLPLMAQATGMSEDTLRALNGMPPEIEKVKKPTVDWEQELQNISNLIRSFPGGLGAIGQALSGLLAGTAAIGAALKSFSKAKEAGGVGGFFGQLSSGLGIATAAIGIGKAIVGLFKSDPVKQAQKEAGKALGHAISREMAEAILAKSKELGVSIAEAARQMELEAARSAAQAAKQALDERRANERAGIDRATEGANKLAGGIAGLSPAAAKTSAELFGKAFWAKLALDGPAAAAEAFGPAFDELVKNLKAKGIDTAFLDPIAKQIGLGKNKQYAGAASAASGAADIIGGLRQAGRVDRDLLATSGKLAQQLFNDAKGAAEKAGFGPQEAAKAGFGAIGGLLEEQLNASIASGNELDENTKRLIEEARANGIDIVADPILQQLAVEREQLKVLNKIAGIAEKPPPSHETPQQQQQRQQQQQEENKKRGEEEQRRHQGGGSMGAASGLMGFTGASSPLIQTHPGEFVSVIPRATLFSLASLRKQSLGSPSIGGAGAGGSAVSFAPQINLIVDASGNDADAVGESCAEAMRRETPALMGEFQRFLERAREMEQ